MRKLLWKTLLLACFSLALMFSFRQANHAYASRLVATSTILKNPFYELNKGKGLHYFTKTSYRVASSLQELPDPYHRELVPFLSTARIEETWITSDTVHSITRLDDVDQTILGEFIKRADTLMLYDAIAGNASKSSGEVQTTVTSANLKLDQTSWISGIKQSSWQRTAWVVEFTPTAMSPQNFPAFAGNPAANTPMADDLHFEQTQWVWEIDQETGLLVSTQLLALTDKEPTVLFSEIYSSPEIMSASTLPGRLDEFMQVGATNLLDKIGQTANLSAEEAAPLMFGTTTPSEQIANEAGFSLYAPDESVLRQFEPQYNKMRIYYNPNHQCHLDETLGFDFDLCAGLGQTVKLEYLFSNLATYEDLRSVFISQGPVSQVRSRLQKALPHWQSSKSVTLNIGGKQVQSWKLLLDQGEQKADALLFELNDTMIQVNGYKTTSEELKAVAESLKLINRAMSSSDGHIFIPFIQR